MFSHKEFTMIEYENLPEDVDMLLVSENEQNTFEKGWVNFFEDESISPYDAAYKSLAIHVASKNNQGMNLKLFILSRDRYHQTPIFVPKRDFVKSVRIYNYDSLPCIFVKHTCFENIVKSQFSCFALIDQIDYKNETLVNSPLKDYHLIRRNCLEEVAKKYPQVIFIVYSDSVLIRMPWILSEYSVMYNPEMMVSIFKTLSDKFKNVMGFDSYAIFTTGINDSPDNKFFYSNESSNLLDLHCYSFAFSNLYSIDSTIKRNIKNSVHDPINIYLDEDFLLTLKISHEYKQALLDNKYEYLSVFGERKYYCTDITSAILNQDWAWK